MNATAIAGAARRRIATRAGDRTALAVFAGALFLSAALLFSVQPMFARLVLPTLGGSPSVWAVAMCFLQATLLLGYGYAHLLNRYGGARLGLALHLILLAAALASLPFGLPEMLGPPPAEGAYLWLIGVLTLGVGLPFFAVSANAPLLQAWFARTDHPDAADPYFLYGASNLGSLLALLAYPVLVEPLFGLARQGAIWADGLALLAGLVLVWLTPATATAIVEAAASTWTDRCAWVLLAMVPSGLLVAFTTHLTTDLASAPFLWVLPLAVFLATFILTFRDRPIVPHRWALAVQPVAVAAAAAGLILPGAADWTWGLFLGAGFVAFVATTLVAHRILYERRPASSGLTAFYLWMSFGGVLGGVFAGLLAPQIFDEVQE